MMIEANQTTLVEVLQPVLTRGCIFLVVMPSSKNEKALGCTEGWFASCQELKNIAFVAHLVPHYGGIGHLQYVGSPHKNIKVEFCQEHCFSTVAGDLRSSVTFKSCNTLYILYSVLGTSWKGTFCPCMLEIKEHS